MNRIILLILLTTPFFAQAQFETFGYKHGLLVRGKFYAGPTSTENQFGKLWTAGGEFRFFNQHAIGVDWVSFYNQYERESLSPSGFYENNGTYDIKTRNYLLIDYRYYVTGLDILAVPYINVLTKIGHQNEWFYDGVGPNKNIPYSFSSEFKEIGLAGGIHIPFGKIRMGIDLSLGIVRMFQDIKYQPELEVYNKWKPHMRMNLYFHIFKIGDEKERYYR